MSVPMRAMVVALVLVVAACDAGENAGPTDRVPNTTTTSTVKSTSADSPPDISEINIPGLILAALDQGSLDKLERLWLHTGYSRMNEDATAWDQIEFTEEEQEAISDATGLSVVFIADPVDIYGENDALPDGERFVGFSQLRYVKSGVVAIDQHIGCGLLCVGGSTLLFQWSGQGWMIASPTEVDVTVTTSIS